MSILYPTALDTLTNPVGTNNLGTPAHATQHADANDAIEAIETTVGTTAGTNVLKNFAAGQFPVRNTGGGATGTLVQTLVGGTLSTNIINNATVGTPAITGGTANTMVLGTPTVQGTVINTANIADQAVTSRKAALTFLTGTIATYGTTGTGSFVTATGNRITIGTANVPTASYALVWASGRWNHSAAPAAILMRFSDGTTTVGQVEYQTGIVVATANSGFSMFAKFACAAEVAHSLDIQIFNRTAGTASIVDGTYEAIIIAQ